MPSVTRYAAPLTAILAIALLALAVPPSQAAGSYSAPFLTAIDDLTVANEVRTGYDRDEFDHWVDADGDGCDARREVLIDEADDPVTVGSGCSLSGGRWYSYYDGVSVYDDSEVDMDHLVPLAEAWDSGARTWSASTRESFANDLGDYRTLVGVTASSNRSKGDRDPREWMPALYQCRYLQQWVAVKHRWRLSVDAAERDFLRDEAAALGCSNTTISVAVAR
ncbi:HNH endonuclease family protein [Nocardioides panacisoli]|uniref:HNH endonuclease family protein n=1 Tax=Nocardioides panacisoli TaxID=627624 RepID=UPI001C62D923|nr:HNH endonuclease family protein [Nocardioides panacisoli]QYJ03307.1 HNH endonuclease family protein [Nocardioides panacisoli]